MPSESVTIRIPSELLSQVEAYALKEGLIKGSGAVNRSKALICLIERGLEVIPISPILWEELRIKARSEGKAFPLMLAECLSEHVQERRANDFSDERIQAIEKRFREMTEQIRRLDKEMGKFNAWE